MPTAFGDMSVVDSLISGVDLGGVEPPCALFPERRRPMQIHPDQLDAQAQIRREETMRRRPPSDPDDSAALISETNQEIESGYLLGPFSSVEEVSEFLGCQCWSLSPRFLLRQGEDGKVRVIDDFSASAVNQSFESHSHLVLQDTDFTVGLLRFLARVLLNKAEVVVPLSDGQVLRGSWSREMLLSPPLLAKTIDLRDEGWWFVVFSVQREKPTQRVFGSREKEREFLLEPLRNAVISRRALARTTAIASNCPCLSSPCDCLCTCLRGLPAWVPEPQLHNFLEGFCVSKARKGEWQRSELPSSIHRACRSARGSEEERKPSEQQTGPATLRLGSGSP